MWPREQSSPSLNSALLTPQDTADYVKPVTFSVEYSLEDPDQGPMLDNGWPTTLRVSVREAPLPHIHLQTSNVLSVEGSFPHPPASSSCPQRPTASNGRTRLLCGVPMSSARGALSGFLGKCRGPEEIRDGSHSLICRGGLNRFELALEFAEWLTLMNSPYLPLSIPKESLLFASGSSLAPQHLASSSRPPGTSVNSVGGLLPGKSTQGLPISV